MNGVVIDTNVFVAAGFNSRSAATRILAAVRQGHLQLVWNKPTRRETETILHRIPGLDWARVADLFRPEGEFTGPVDPDAFVMIADRDDRKFAALSAVAKTPLVTSDNRLLAQRDVISVEILSPRAFVAREFGHFTNVLLRETLEMRYAQGVQGRVERVKTGSAG
jgi:predicted nucleic acid-binding protein